MKSKIFAIHKNLVKYFQDFTVRRREAFEVDWMYFIVIIQLNLLDFLITFWQDVLRVFF